MMMRNALFIRAATATTMSSFETENDETTIEYNTDECVWDQGISKLEHLQQPLDQQCWLIRRLFLKALLGCDAAVVTRRTFNSLFARRQTDATNTAIHQQNEECEAFLRNIGKISSIARYANEGADGVNC
jgi:hypothetical protein